MDENYIIGTVLLCGISFWLGIHYAQVKLMFRLRKEPDKFIDMLNQIKEINQSEDMGMPEDAVEVEIEQVGKVYYAYEKSNGKFLGQANSFDEVMVEASRRDPNKTFWYPEIKEERQTT